MTLPSFESPPRVTATSVRGDTAPTPPTSPRSVHRARFASLALLATLLPACFPAHAAELVLDFTRLPPGTPPAEFRPDLTGSGSAPDWKVIQVPTSPTLPKLIPDRPEPTVETVVAQLSEDTTDERFPVLVYDKETFGDFTAALTF
ncbi:MAG: hypothetical protein JNL97_07920, partial [Verrucomicrobiales bacterium]|nr:hypothetical protein [Verrucomicrobiales bacterium]